MSTILQALKKSEAERRETLGTPGMAPAPEPPRKRWVLFAGVAVGVALILVSLRWLPESSPSAPAAGEAAPAVTVPAGRVVAPPDAVPDEAAMDQTVPDVPEARTVISEPRPARPAPPSEPTGGSLSSDLPTAMGGAPILAAPIDDMDPELLEESPMVGAGTPAFESDDLSMSELPPPRFATPASEPVSRTTVPPVVSPSRVEPVRSRSPVARAPGVEPPSVSFLPAGVARDHLSGLKLNMHVYAEAPSERFVLVDLRRRIEGDDLGQGIRIARITSAGVVIEVEGTEWLWSPGR